MKKLFIVMGCFAAIVLTSSCTADNPVETKSENLITPSKPPVPGTDVFADGKEDPLPPKP